MYEQQQLRYVVHGRQVPAATYVMNNLLQPAPACLSLMFCAQRGFVACWWAEAITIMLIDHHVVGRTHRLNRLNVERRRALRTRRHQRRLLPLGDRAADAGDEGATPRLVQVLQKARCSERRREDNEKTTMLVWQSQW